MIADALVFVMGSLFTDIESLYMRLTQIKALRGRHHSYPHFTDEKTEG